MWGIEESWGMGMTLGVWSDSLCHDQSKRINRWREEKPARMKRWMVNSGHRSMQRQFYNHKSRMWLKVWNHRLGVDLGANWETLHVRHLGTDSGFRSLELSLPWALDLRDPSSKLWGQKQACKSLEIGQTSAGLGFGLGYGLKYLDCLENLDILYLKWNVRVIC